MAMSEATYDGIGSTVEAALSCAQDKIPLRPGRDYTRSRVVEFGLQRGGIADESLYVVRIVEAEDAPFLTKHDLGCA